MLLSNVNIKNFDSELTKNTNPFMDPKNLKLICSYLDCEMVEISLINNSEIDWIGCFFIKTNENSRYLFSGGRFGYAGFVEVNGKAPVSSYLDKIEESLKFLSLSSISLSISYLSDNITNKLYNGWILSKLTYFVAKTSECVSNQKLIFKKSKVNSIKKMLKKSQQEKLTVEFVTSEEDVDEWYYNCHLIRISELNGKKWELTLIKDLFNRGYGELIVAKNQKGDILGGCFTLLSKKTLELFMISTPNKNLKLGTNYLIVKELYLFAEKNKIDFINWQASNPPIGPISFFKERWNCSKRTLSILNKKFTNDIYADELSKKFPNCYIFPYEYISSYKKEF